MAFLFIAEYVNEPSFAGIIACDNANANALSATLHSSGVSRQISDFLSEKHLNKLNECFQMKKYLN